MFRTIDNDTFQKELKDAGYSQYPTHNELHDALFQRCIYGDGKKLYFINVRFWNFAKYEKSEGRVSYDVYVAFYNADGYFRIEFSIGEDETIQCVESRMANFYIANNCVPDMHNN